MITAMRRRPRAGSRTAWRDRGAGIARAINLDDEAVTILLLTGEADALRPVVKAAGLGARAEVIPDALAGLARLSETTWDLVAIDADWAGGSALELVEALVLSGQRVVVLAARPTPALTIRALRAGARDVLPLPPPAEQLRQLATDAAGLVAAPRATGGALDAWIGSSPAMLDAFRGAVRLAAVETPILIWGETGTGKELIARLVHEQGPRAAGPFVTVNCGALPDRVMESELFGHERGAFAGAYARRVGRLSRAAGGTLLLDELPQLSVRLQSKLATVLGSGVIETPGSVAEEPLDVRVIATADADPSALLSAGRLHDALYHALSGGTIAVPPLRERGWGDVRQLCDHYVREYAGRYDRTIRGIADDAWQVLRRQRWPGNVRQLRAVCERAVTEADGDIVHAAHLPAELRRADHADAADDLTLVALERRHIARVLELASGHLGRTAELLGVHRNTLRRKIVTYGLGDDRAADVTTERQGGSS
jgi:DNA-binding NtrC family response regulator